MDETRLKKDWFTGNAVISFLGALMLAQTWRTTGSGYELPFNITVPAFPDPMSFTIAAVLFLSSFLLAVASVIPIRLVPHWVVPVVSTFSVVLDLFVWLAFLQSWLTIVSELPDDQWWAYAFAWGGLVMFLFLGFRFFYGMFRVAAQSNPKPGANSGDPERTLNGAGHFPFVCGHVSKPVVPGGPFIHAQLRLSKGS